MTASGTGSDERGERVRLDVRKTYKLYIGGSFPRSESGRSLEIRAADGSFLANAARASRKDLRDAVVAARKAFEGWVGRTAYNRGQILYRIAEVLEGRRQQFVTEVAAGEGLDHGSAQRQVDEAIDRWVWYAGWTDKIAQVAGSANPVAGPYFNFSVPEPTGVVGIIAPATPSLLGLVSVVAPAVAAANTVVVLASQPHPLPAVTLTEVLATSDVPGGVINVLTGYVDEITPVMAAHRDIDAVDLSGVSTDALAELETAAADNVKRVRRPRPENFYADPGVERLLAFTETKTVWHPMGL